MKYFVAINFAIDFNNTYLRKRICPEEIEKGSSREFKTTFMALSESAN